MEKDAVNEQVHSCPPLEDEADCTPRTKPPISYYPALGGSCHIPSHLARMPISRQLHTVTCESLGSLVCSTSTWNLTVLLAQVHSL